MKKQRGNFRDREDIEIENISMRLSPTSYAFPQAIMVPALVLSRVARNHSQKTVGSIEILRIFGKKARETWNDVELQRIHLSEKTLCISSTNNQSSWRHSWPQS